MHIREVQKVRAYYGVSMRQLRVYVNRATRAKGPTGENLLRVLERRLDNVVFQLGLAPTIVAGRQLVRRGHITVNGRCVIAPTRHLTTGNVVAVRAKSRSDSRVVEGVTFGPELVVPSWLEREPDEFSGRVVGAPERTEVPLEVNENLIVELYVR